MKFSVDYVTTPDTVNVDTVEVEIDDCKKYPEDITLEDIEKALFDEDIEFFEVDYFKHLPDDSNDEYEEWHMVGDQIWITRPYQQRERRA